MKYRNRKNRLRFLHCLLGLIASTALCVSFTGCATPKPKPEVAFPVLKPAETIRLHFKRPLIVRTPEKDPVTTDEHIRCGLFYFEQERFAAAANEFEKARKGISGRQNPLYRACLMSAGVCHLFRHHIRERIGDINGYFRTMGRTAHTWITQYLQ